MSDARRYDPYAVPTDAIREPPESLWQALRNIGPGIILAGSIVGSGELLLTTSLGAEFGYVFMWLIIFSCIVKVFVQIELGRYAISSGKPTLGAMNELPGPRFGAHWLVWWWLVMLMCTVSQLGAMTGGVGQALHLALPEVSATIQQFAEPRWPELAAMLERQPAYPWAFVTCLLAIGLLWSGGYRRIEFLTTYLVASVTLLTVACVLVLPATDYPIRLEKLAEGFMFFVPAAGISAAFGAFGITGVGASELYAYPYWCLEKGYARYAGPREESEAWARRARGWIRVMKLDAWCSMVVFTVATIAFYIMGAAVLEPQGLRPKGTDMIATLSQMYVGPFGSWTTLVFLFGAAAVLFKTLYVSSAGHSRLTADFLSLAGVVEYRDPWRRGRYIRAFSIFYPILALVLFLIFKEPRAMVIFGGIAQAATLPIISGATVYFRYCCTDRRLLVIGMTDVLLWLAFLSITLVASYAVWDKLSAALAA